MNSKILLHRMSHNVFFVIGCVLCVLILVSTLASPLYTHYDPIKTSLAERLLAPDGLAGGLDGHILGTDSLGRDIFTRLVIGGSASLIIAFVTVLLQMFIGTVLGMLAGFFGGIIDTVIMRMCDVILAVPNIVLAIAVMAVLGPSVTNLVIVLTITGWVRYCKVTRNNVMVVKKQEFVSASRVLGGSNGHIMFTQIFPNVTTQLIIMASSRIGGTILIESALSFLGLGIPAPTPSWGNMIADGRQYLATCPWVVFAPGIALMVTVLAFNFLGDGLRDILDPKKF